MGATRGVLGLVEASTEAAPKATTGGAVVTTLEALLAGMAKATVVTTALVVVPAALALLKAWVVTRLKAGLLAGTETIATKAVTATEVVAALFVVAVAPAFGLAAKAAVTTAKAAALAAAAFAALAAKGFARWVVKALLGFQAGNGFGLEGLLGVVLDVANLSAVADFGKGHGNAAAASTARTANAVGVVLGLHGQSEVEHVRDGGHVNTARGHVGGDQNLHLAVAQRHQAAVAQALAQGAVQRHSGKAGLLQFGGQAVAFDLRAGKHNGLVNAGVAQPVVEQLALVLGVVGPEQHLLDVGVFFLRAVDLHFVHSGAAVVHDAHGQLLNAGCKRGREHHGLAALGGQIVDFGQVVGEAQVQHAVGFVNHQKLHFIEFDLHGALQVQQAARRGHHQVGVLQLGNLQLVRNAAHHVGNAQAFAVLDQLDGVVRHLLRQFARGAQHQGAGHGGFEVARVGGVFTAGALGWLFATGKSVGAGLVEIGLGFGVGSGLLLNQGVQHGQQEGGGFAAAGLAGDHQVVVAVVCFVVRRQGQRNGLRLHAGGLGVAQVGHGLNEFLGQAQLHKAVGLGGFAGLDRFGCVDGKVLRRHVLGLQVGDLFSHEITRTALQRVAAGTVRLKTTSTFKRCSAKA